MTFAIHDVPILRRLNATLSNHQTFPTLVPAYPPTPTNTPFPPFMAPISFIRGISDVRAELTKQKGFQNARRSSPSMDASLDPSRSFSLNDVSNIRAALPNIFSLRDASVRWRGQRGIKNATRQRWPQHFRRVDYSSVLLL